MRCASVQEKNALASVSRPIGLPVRSDTISSQMCLCGKTKTCSPLGQFRAPSRSARKPACRRRCSRDGRGPFCRSGFAAQDCQNSSQSCRRNNTVPMSSRFAWAQAYPSRPVRSNRAHIGSPELVGGAWATIGLNKHGKASFGPGTAGVARIFFP